MDLIDDLNDLYNDVEIRIEEQDLRILKAIVSDDAAAREFCGVYDADLFVGDAKSFAQKVISYYKGYKVAPTRRVMLEIAESNPDLISEINYVWDSLDSIEYNPSEFQWDLDKIKDRFTKTKLVTIRNGIDDLDDSVDFSEQLKRIRADLDAAEKIRKGKQEVYTQKTLKEYMPEFRDEFVQKSKDPSLGKGLLTGYSYLDYVTNGLSPSDMLIIGGETGGGKSMLLHNMATQMWLQGIDLGDPKTMKGANVQYFSLEMPYKQCVRRMMARLSGVPSYSLRDCQITDPIQLENLAKAANFIRKFPYEFEVVDIPRGVTMSTIEDRYLEAVALGRAPDIVVIDYLGLMEMDNHVTVEDWLKLGHIGGQLHEFSRTYDVVVLTAVQLNRPKGKSPSEIIGLHRIGRSSLIMHHATVGIQIETREDEETYSDMIYHIIKNRNGERGKHLLKKDFRRATLIDCQPYKPMEDDDIGNFSSVQPTMEDISYLLSQYDWNE